MTRKMTRKGIEALQAALIFAEMSFNQAMEDYGNNRISPKVIEAWERYIFAAETLAKFQEKNHSTVKVDG